MSRRAASPSLAPGNDAGRKEAPWSTTRILAAVSGGKASAGVIELACRLARRFGSHLEAYHVRLDPRELVVVATDGLGTPLTADIIETATREAEAPRRPRGRCSPRR